MEKIIPEWDLSDIGIFCYEHITEKIKKPFTEDTMINIINQQSNWYDVLQAISALRKIGTEKSIKYLKKIVIEYNGIKKMDIQASGVLTIAKLANGVENEFLGGLLLNKEYKTKWYAMAAIFYKINNEALPYVLEYGMKKIKKSKNMPESGGLVLIYLAKYAHENEQSKKIFSKVNNDIEEMNVKLKQYLNNEYPNIFK